MTLSVKGSQKPFQQKNFLTKTLPIDLRCYDGILLMLDFDGTLVPIVNDPALCYPSFGVREYLAKIARTGRNIVAVVSGRSLSDVRNRIAIENIYYSGSHGLEITGPGLDYVSSEAIRMKPVINKLRILTENKIGHLKGVLIEKKHFSFSFHYRMMEQETIGEALKEFQSLLSQERTKDSITVMRGKKVLEVMPRTVQNKGSAIQTIMDHFCDKLLPLYVGDDITDESAFQVLGDKGITIRIMKKRDSAAKYFLKSQKDISPFLARVYSLAKELMKEGRDS